MNKAMGMHPLPHLRKQSRRDRITLNGTNRNRHSDKFLSHYVDESPIPAMRLAALISLSAMASTLLLALYLFQ